MNHQEPIVKKLMGSGKSRFSKIGKVQAQDANEFPEDDTDIIIAPEAVKTEALAAPKYAASLIVRDQDTLDGAKSFLMDVKRLTEKLDNLYDERIDQAHKLHKGLLADKKQFMAPLELAEQITKRTIAGYLAEEDRKRREAEAERARIEAAARAEAEKALKAVERAEAKGDSEKAQALADAAVAKMESAIDAAPIIPDAPEAGGLSLREDWKFSIADKSLLPREYLMPDEVKIGRVVRALKGEANIPGVSVWSKRTVAARMN
jgi:hypothetical protein